MSIMPAVQFLRDFPLTQDDHSSLPTITTSLDRDAVLGKLTKLSKNGKLAGFESDGEYCLATVAAHGTPFDSEMLIRHENGRVLFELKMLSMMPRIFALLLIITIWPGLPLTDGFLASFTWYSDFEASTGIKTWYWYLPLTILPAPFAWKSSISKSKLSAQQSAIETIDSLRKALGSN